MTESSQPHRAYYLPDGTWVDPDCIECGGDGAPCCEPPYVPPMFMVGDAVARRQDRCPSCDHLREFHSEPGCWLAVTKGTPGKSLGCPCTVVSWPSEDEFLRTSPRPWS